MRHARAGFTLIELLAVILVLSVLVGLALPRFLDAQDEARESACKGALAGVRAGIAGFYADKAINGSPAYPHYNEIDVANLVVQGELPDNPYNNKNTVVDWGLGDANARSNNNTTGWAYYVNNSLDPPEAVFWPNSNVAGENTF